MFSETHKPGLAAGVVTAMTTALVAVGIVVLVETRSPWYGVFVAIFTLLIYYELKQLSVPASWFSALVVIWTMTFLSMDAGSWLLRLIRD